MNRFNRYPVQISSLSKGDLFTLTKAYNAIVYVFYEIHHGKAIYRKDGSRNFYETFLDKTVFPLS